MLLQHLHSLLESVLEWMPCAEYATKRYRKEEEVAKGTGYLDAAVIHAWNERPQIKPWAKLRAVAFYTCGTLWGIIALWWLVIGVDQVPVKGSDVILSRTTLIRAVVALSTLCELSSHLATMWLRVDETRLLPYSPLFNVRPVEWWSDLLWRHPRAEGALVHSMLALLLGSIFSSSCIPFVLSLYLSLVLADALRFFYTNQWAFMLLALASGREEDQQWIGVILACTYIYSGLSKLWSKSFYKDVSPYFFTDIFRLIRERVFPGEALARRADWACHAVAFKAVLVETAMGSLFLLCSLGFLSEDSLFLRLACLTNVGMHGYIMIALRELSLFNWNFVCMLLCQLLFWKHIPLGDDSLAQLQRLNPVALTIAFMYFFFPSLVYIGHGWGRSFCFNFYVTLYDGERLLITRSEEVKNNPLLQRVGPDPIWRYASVENQPSDGELSLAKQDQERDSYEDLLDWLAEDQKLSYESICLALQLQVAKGDTARSALLRSTVALDANVSEMVHCLERPANKDRFSCCSPIMLASYYRWIARKVVRAPCALVTYQHWTWRGYQTWVERVDL